ncbi:hypothetical protein BK011_03890 [Tenericutes bacterium MZ-XQ]|jgi:hypothetical protein|nr:hypothetical protein BK011_03890 [Tenericutes bacterium MZ-XQ]
MNIYRKSLVIQLIMFIVFLIMGANIIIQHYVSDTFPAYNFIILGVLVLFGVFGFLLYKNSSDQILPITEQIMKTLKGILYAYLFVYILEMILSNMEQLPTDIVKIGFGSVLMILAIAGIYIQTRLLTHK